MNNISYAQVDVGFEWKEVFLPYLSHSSLVQAFFVYEMKLSNKVVGKWQILYFKNMRGTKQSALLSLLYPSKFFKATPISSLSTLHALFPFYTHETKLITLSFKVKITTTYLFKNHANCPNPEYQLLHTSSIPKILVRI